MMALWSLYQALDVRRRKGHPKPGQKRHLVRLGTWYQPMLKLADAYIWDPNDYSA